MTRSITVLLIAAFLVFGYGLSQALQLRSAADAKRQEARELVEKTTNERALLATVSIPPSRHDAAPVDVVKIAQRAGQIKTVSQTPAGTRLAALIPPSALPELLTSRISAVKLSPFDGRMIEADLTYGDQAPRAKPESIEELVAVIQLNPAASASLDATPLLALFSPSTPPVRPAPSPVARAPEPFAAPPPFVFLGTLGRSGVFKEEATGLVLSVKVGEKIDGWRVASIDSNHAVLASVTAPVRRVTIRR